LSNDITARAGFADISGRRFLLSIHIQLQLAVSLQKVTTQDLQRNPLPASNASTIKIKPMFLFGF